MPIGYADDMDGVIAPADLLEINRILSAALRERLHLPPPPGISLDEIGHSAIETGSEDDELSVLDGLDRVRLCEALYRHAHHRQRTGAGSAIAAALPDAVAAICRAAHNLVALPEGDARGGLVGGLFVEWSRRDGAAATMHAWVLDRGEPERPVRIRVLIDGQLSFTGVTVPNQRPPILDLVFPVVAGRDIRLEAGNAVATVRIPASASHWDDLDALDALRAHLRAGCEPAPRHAAVSAADPTPRISARLDGARGEGAVRERVPGFLRYLAARLDQSQRVGTPIAAVSWVIGELLEDPARRHLFHLSADTAALFGEPAFSRKVASPAATLALFAFWRRHYSSIDIFSEVGLRRILYNFATAPYMAENNNNRMVSDLMRDQLSRTANDIKGGEVGWSWFWVLQHEDRGEAARLHDPRYARLMSLRETAADLVRPGRLSFSPRAWQGTWSAVDRRSNSPLTRFDVAVLGVLAAQPAAFVLAALGPASCGRLLSGFYASHPRLLPLSGVAAPDPVPPPPVPEPEPHGLVVIGHHNQTGLGRNFAMFARALEPLRPVLVDAEDGSCITGEELAGLRARVVLLCVNADRAPEIVARFSTLCEHARVIGFFLWETDRPPEGHRLGTEVVDEIWCPTEYVAATYRRITATPVSNVRKGLETPPDIPMVRALRGLNRTRFTFLCLAEFGSGIMRKNPLAVVRAFELAFPDPSDDDVRLVIKLREIVPDHWSNQGGYWEEMEERIAADPRMLLVVGDLSDDEYWALLADADVFVTLHRSEGFGYGAADALMCERGVIATDHSGTADFCDEQTAYLVRHVLVPVPPQQLREHGYIGNWAEPDCAHAAARMREARDDRDGLVRRGRAGSARVRELFGFDAWRDGIIARVRQDGNPVPAARPAS